jgi:hypothetical protein
MAFIWIAKSYRAEFYAFFRAAVFFAALLRFAQDFAIATDIFDLKSASSGGAITSAIVALTVFFFGATVSAFAALIAAHRFF